MLFINKMNIKFFFFVIIIIIISKYEIQLVLFYLFFIKNESNFNWNYSLEMPLEGNSTLFNRFTFNMITILTICRKVFRYYPKASGLYLEGLMAFLPGITIEVASS